MTALQRGNAFGAGEVLNWVLTIDHGGWRRDELCLYNDRSRQKTSVLFFLTLEENSASAGG